MAVEPELALVRSDVRFAGAGDASSRVTLEGDLTVGPGLASLDPRVDSLRVTLGPVVLFDGPAPGDRVRVRAGSGEWRIEARAGSGDSGRVNLRLVPASGRFRLKAKGVAAAALREAGPAGVAVRLMAGGETYESAGDFVPKGGDRWCYRMPPATGRPPPGGGGGGGGGGDGGAPVPLQTLAQGFTSNIRSFRFAVVKDAASWQALWAEHGGPGPAPSVDFTTEMVIGYWIGARPTDGRWAQISGITGADAPPGQTGALVTLEEFQPAAGCPVAQVVTYPFHIVRSSIRADVVTYEQFVRIAYCL